MACALLCPLSPFAGCERGRVSAGGRNQLRLTDTLEVDVAGDVVFTYATNTRSGSVSSPLPTHAVRLRNGNILISDQFNMQVIEINPAKHIVFTQGTIAVAGNTFDKLNAPYDAKVVGNYTGLTPPFDDDDNF